MTGVNVQTHPFVKSNSCLAITETTLTRADLKPGDIVLQYDGLAVIKVGQFISNLWSSYSGDTGLTHAQIVVDEHDQSYWEKNVVVADDHEYKIKKWDPMLCIHSTSHGVTLGEPNRRCKVWRLKGDKFLGSTGGQIASTAAAKALELAGKKKANPLFATYAYSKCFGAVFKNSSSKRENLDQSNQFFCSEFVVICYQMALYELYGQGNVAPTLGFSNKNAAAMNPSFLDGMFQSFPIFWQCVTDGNAYLAENLVN